MIARNERTRGRNQLHVTTKAIVTMLTLRGLTIVSVKGSNLFSVNGDAKVRITVANGDSPRLITVSLATTGLLVVFDVIDVDVVGAEPDVSTDIRWATLDEIIVNHGGL